MSHSQQLWAWWSGLKFHTLQAASLQHAASHAEAVRLGFECMFLHCRPARLCGKLQLRLSAATSVSSSSSRLRATSAVTRSSTRPLVRRIVLWGISQTDQLAHCPPNEQQHCSLVSTTWR